MVSDNPETFADLDGHEGQGPSTDTGCKSTSNKCNDDQSNHDQNAASSQQPPATPNNTPGAPLNPPAPPPGAFDKTQFPTEDSAATNALDRVNGQSKSEDSEYSGWVEPAKNGTWSIDTANKGTKDSSDPGPKPSPDASSYHTHGANDPGYDNEHFSPQDKQNIEHANHKYLETPSGAVKKFDPSTGRITTLRKGTEP